ncbi:MAG TPA: radical SAM protein [Sedimenticola sp.]|nr:radical SAM protein [Sedimenticola sp.]
MRLITQRKLAGILRREAERRGAGFLPFAPSEIYIDPCNACDLRCTFCPQSNWGGRRRGLMSRELFELAIEQAVELRPQRVNLFCYGESLLHKDIAEMVRHAAGRGLWVRIHTNARSLDADKARRLIESGLSEIRFSFDTPDRELYNRLRVGGDFDAVLANIRGFIRIKQELGAVLPRVYLQEMIPFEAGKKARNSEAYRRLFEGRDVIFSARYMHNFAGASQEAGFAGLQAVGESPCREIYRRLVVTFDGKIHACCLDAEGHNIIGDLSRGDTIASAWNGGAMRDLRRRTSTHKLEGLDPCQHCDELRRNRRPVKLSRRLVGGLAWYAVKPFIKRD